MLNRIEALEEARALSLAGDYKAALAHVDSIIERDPRDIDALRLKGNIIELQVFEEESRKGAKHVHSEKFGKARACYDQILLLEPDHVGAWVDLGTHWKNLGQYDNALRCYERVIALLSSNEVGRLHRDELFEALEGKAEVCRHQGNLATAVDIEKYLQQLIADE